MPKWWISGKIVLLHNVDSVHYLVPTYLYLVWKQVEVWPNFLVFESLSSVRHKLSSMEMQTFAIAVVYRWQGTMCDKDGMRC